jgi:hypothetical protein
VPYTFAGISPSSLLGTTITLAVWNPLTISYAVSPTPPANAFTLGQGYWVRLSAAASLYKTGEAADPTIPFQVALGAGWNMIGDPFEVTAPIANMTFQIGTASPVTYAQAVSSGLITGALFTFGPSDSAYEVKGPSDSLQPYWGYWIYANQACNVNISATPAG